MNSKTRRKIIFFVLKLLVALFLLIVVGFLFLFIFYSRDLPRPEKFGEKRFLQSTKIYDRTGEVLLYDIYGEEKREVVPLSKIPDFLKNAVIATEDANFYRHHGLDFKGILRAVLVNLRIKKPAQGGSTISQQLIRSSFLTRQKTLERKVREVILTLELERRYPKNQILEWYLNQIYFGGNSYGVETASQTYFRKSISDVSLAQAAALAALIQAPSRLSPYGSYKNELLKRKDRVLERMLELGFIDQEQKNSAQKEKLGFADVLQPIKAPHFVLYIKESLEEKYGENFLKESGLKIYTTLDWNLQSFAEKTIEEIAERNESYDAHNAALVAVNPKNGEILAMAGSKNYWGESYPEDCWENEATCLFNPQFNVAVLGERQPGSAFKPFVYATAFKKGYAPDTVLWDAKTEFNPSCNPDASEEKDKNDLECYHPQNYDGKFRGKVSLRDSLAQSINVTSVKLLYLAGVKDSIETAKSFGINTLDDINRYGLSLVLGGGEVTLLEMTSAYGVFAADGLRVPTTGILKIEDLKSNIIEENKKDPKRVLGAQVARLINDVLSDNRARTPIFGPSSLLSFPDYQVAAKTGTTQNFIDGWTIGYTPFIAVGVWVGNNNNSFMAKEPGIVLAGPIWRRIMDKILISHPKESFKEPEPAIREKDVLNGRLPEEDFHELLHYINKDDPLGDSPKNPGNDPQYFLWEKGVESWLKENEQLPL